MHDIIRDHYVSRLQIILRDAYVQDIHRSRRLLSGYKLNPAQVIAYQTRVQGINDRLAKVLARKRK